MLSDPVFFDNGRTGERVAVDLRAIANGLEIRDRRDGLMLALWAFDDIVAVGPKGRRARCLRLGSRSDAGDRLSVEDPALIDSLRQAVPRLALPRFPWRRLGLAVLGLAGLGLALALCYEGLLLVARPLANALPSSWEQALGERLAARLVAGYGGACRTAAGDAALAELARRFTETSVLRLPVTLQVVKSSRLNAFILPGGQIVLLSGLILEAAAADELAGVVAHLLAHSAAHHPTEQALRHAGVGLYLLLAGDRPGGSTESAANPLPDLPFTRQAESEADAMGRRLLEQAAIPAQPMGNFFRRMAQKEKVNGAPPDFLGNHPLPDKRPDPGPTPPFTRPALTDGEWASLRAICE